MDEGFATRCTCGNVLRVWYHDSLAKARREALEEAARVCEALQTKWDGHDMEAGAGECIAAIRALIDRAPSSPDRR